MISLPNLNDLVACVVDAHKSIEARHHRSPIVNADWFPELAAEIAGRANGLHLKCYARGKRRGDAASGCVGSEWLFDFCALAEDQDVGIDDRFVAQAAIVGEIEWGPDVDQDFEKLQIVDSLVCFMTFQEWSEDGANKQLERLMRAAQRRQEYAAARGATRPPVFVLFCCVLPEHRFRHRVVEWVPPR
jgi:hypothetical protein